MLESIIVLIAFLLVVCAVLGAIAWWRSRHLAEELESLKRDVTQLMGTPHGTRPRRGRSRRSARSARPGTMEPAEAPETSATPAPGIPPQSPAAPPSDVPLQSIEETLTSRWLVWGGSVALAAGGLEPVREFRGSEKGVLRLRDASRRYAQDERL